MILEADVIEGAIYKLMGVRLLAIFLPLSMNLDLMGIRHRIFKRDADFQGVALIGRVSRAGLHRTTKSGGGYIFKIVPGRRQVKTVLQDSKTDIFFLDPRQTYFEVQVVFIFIDVRAELGRQFEFIISQMGYLRNLLDVMRKAMF